MNMGRLEWNSEEGEAIVLFSNWFMTSHRVVQLDALSDWINMLQDTYDEMLSSQKGAQGEQG